MAHATQSDLPVISNLSQFDEQSGNFLERLIFNNRMAILLICALVTLVLGFQATKLQLQAGFEKTLPKAHEYVVNYRANQGALKGLGNNLRIVAAVKEGTIFTPENLKFLEKLNEEIFFVPGVDRNGMKSLFTPNTRWRMVTEEGFEGGPVIPGDYDPTSPKSIGEVQINMVRADILGDLIADDTSTSAETTLANLRPGLYIVRMYTTTTRSDTLLLVE